uniref:Gustatory receptor n=2 Tax=Clastoptera arizonana TaxID=38151 RepID=A0A1B6BW00_9HEMI
MTVTFWFYNCLMISKTSEKISYELVQTLKTNPFRYDVSKYRFILLHLRSIVMDFSSILSNTILGNTITSFLVVICSAYGVTSITMKREFSLLTSMLIPLLFNITILYIYCEGAYKVGQVKQNILKSVLECELVNLRHEVHQEVELVIDAVKSMPPNIDILGFLILHRDTIVKVFGVIVSYLIILAQFRISD